MTKLSIEVEITGTGPNYSKPFEVSDGSDLIVASYGVSLPKICHQCKNFIQENYKGQSASVTTHLSLKLKVDMIEVWDYSWANLVGKKSRLYGALCGSVNEAKDEIVAYIRSHYT